MTTKEQAERLINDLRKQGIADDEITQAIIGMLENMKEAK